MKKVALSKTALTREMLIEFWGDGQPHSVQEFRAYLQQNNMISIEITHIRGALYTATQRETLDRIGRGIYQAGKNLNKGFCIGLKGVLQRAKSILSSPIDVTVLTPKEWEVLPRLQKICWECESLLSELESWGDGHEISE